MNMLKKCLGLGIAALMILPATGAMAAPVTIDFDGIASTNSFASGAEDGFVIAASGPVGLNSLYLSPYSSPNSLHHQSSGQASLTLTRAGGGDFSLTSFFAGSAFGGANPLTLSGYLDGVLVGSDVFSSISLGSFMNYTPVNLAGDVLDTLVFDMGPATMGPTHIDNIVLDTVDVPEPASLALLGLGMVAGAFARRRKQ